MLPKSVKILLVLLVGCGARQKKNTMNSTKSFANSKLHRWNYVSKERKAYSSLRGRTCGAKWYTGGPELCSLNLRTKGTSSSFHHVLLPFSLLSLFFPFFFFLSFYLSDCLSVWGFVSQMFFFYLSFSHLYHRRSQEMMDIFWDILESSKILRNMH